jgi:hypothetical protein
MTRGDDKRGVQLAAERRRLLKGAMIGGVLGPQYWMAPVVDAVVVPAHAAASPGPTTTTTATTTTSPPV